LKAAIALHFMHYNFCRIHKTLRVTPAMEAGLAHHVWSIEELVNLIGFATGYEGFELTTRGTDAALCVGGHFGIEVTLRKILQEYERSPESVTGGGIAAELERTVRQIEHICRRLTEIDQHKIS
jgi:hypothetical protein